MSQYTIELYKLVNSGYNIFDDSWNTVVKSHKEELCDKILRRYWFYEIGQETPDRFKHYLNEHLARIMPYYNQLYKSELLELKPLYDKYMEEEGKQARTRNTGTSEAYRKDSDIIREIAETLNRLINTTSHLNGVHTGDLDARWTEHKDGNENETTKDTKDFTDDATTKVTLGETEKVVTSETDKEVTDDDKNESFTSTQNTLDILQGTKDTTTSTHSSSSSARRYSDTPQGNLNPATGELSITTNYLTNYTQENGTSDSSGTGKEELNNTTTTDVSTKNVTVTQDDKTVDTTKNITTDTTHDTTTDTKFDDTQNTVENGTRNLTYEEDKNGTNNEDTTNNDVEDRTSKEQQDDTALKTDRSRQSDMSVTERDEKEKEEQDHSVINKGFTVSQSVLLNEYRKTFLNIDAEIIEELAVNFMGVF